MADSSGRVLIVGGGVIGCSIAYHLQRAGTQVTLIERGRIGSGASSAAAGMLAPLAESRDTGPFSALALLGLQCFEEETERLTADSGIDIELRRDGVLRVAETGDEEARLRELLAWQPKQGPEVEWLDSMTLRGLEPSLAPGMAGALYSPHEGHVNPSRLTAALASAAARLGTDLVEGAAARGLRRNGDGFSAESSSGGRLHADRLVLADGAWASVSTAGFGIELPVAPVRGQMAALQQTPPPIRRIIYSQDGYLVPKPDGSVWIGATEEHESGFDATVTASGLRWLMGVAERLVPALGSAAFLRSWAGLRPSTPDRLPLLGALPGVDGAFVAGAHFRNGILLSLITGRLMADLIQRGKTAVDLDPFSPVRYAHARG